MGPRSVLEVLLAGAVWALIACAARAATITTVRGARPPKVDGRLDDACWRNAAVVSEFTLFSGGRPASQTEARICFDDDGLYVAFKCGAVPAPPAAPPPQQTGVAPAPAARVDRVAVYLDPAHDRFNYFQFAVDATGEKMDERCDGVGIDPKWDAVWQAATARNEDGSWTCEIALPWTALDPMSSFRRTMGLNLVRRFESGETATWAPVGQRLESTDKWGDLAGLDVDFSPFFVKVHLPLLIEPCVGETVIPFRISDAPPRSGFTLRAISTSLRGAIAEQRVTTDAEGRTSGQLKLALREPGEYRLVALGHADARAHGADVGRLVWSSERMVECKPVAHVTLFESFYRPEVRVRVIAGERAKKVRLRLEPAGPQGFSLNRKQEHALQPGEHFSSFEVGDLQPGAYEVVAEFEDASGKVGQTEHLAFFRSRAPAFKNPGVDIREDNMLLVEGKPFFPIALYAAPSETDEGYAKVAQMGYNVVRSSEQMLEVAQKHGLKVWLNVGQWLDLRQNREANLKALAEFVDRVKNHPALLVYESQDEPVWRQLPLDVFVEGYHELKRLDPDHPLWTNHAPRNTVEDLTIYARSSDIIGTDMYPVPEPQGHSDMADKTLAITGEETEKQRLTVGDTKPVFMVLQGFSWGEILSDPTNKANPVYPTYEQTRFIAYDAIVHGARGLLYWGTHSIERPAFWQDLTRVTRELGKMAPVLAWRDDPQAAKTAVVSGPIDALVKREGKQWVLIAVNRTNKPAHATLRPPTNEPLAVLFEGRTFPRASGGNIGDEFGPYGVHIYAAAHSPLAREMAGVTF